jgi:hypothetical protein
MTSIINKVLDNNVKELPNYIVNLKGKTSFRNSML